MTDREKYLKWRKEARRYQRKYLRYRDGVNRFITLLELTIPEHTMGYISLLERCIGESENDR